MRRKKQKQLRRVDDIHKPRPFLRFRLGAVLLFFAVSMVACLIYYTAALLLAAMLALLPSCGNSA